MSGRYNLWNSWLSFQLQLTNSHPTNLMSVNLSLVWLQHLNSWYWILYEIMPLLIKIFSFSFNYFNSWFIQKLLFNLLLTNTLNNFLLFFLLFLAVWWWVSIQLICRNFRKILPINRLIWRFHHNFCLTDYCLSFNSFLTLLYFFLLLF